MRQEGPARMIVGEKIIAGRVAGGCGFNRHIGAAAAQSIPGIGIEQNHPGAGGLEVRNDLPILRGVVHPGENPLIAADAVSSREIIVKRLVRVDKDGFSGRDTALEILQNLIGIRYS